jgi:hypothetical protein
MNENTNSCFDCSCRLVETCAAGYHPLVGNEFCNDETNIPECGYDGGDCCGCVITEHCEDCACLGNITSGEITNSFVGNSLCNDEMNNLNCNYDGGDCCGYNINLEHCSECTCFHQETCLAGVSHAFIGDSVCNDETNNAGCNYDGGDCCGYNINSEHCTECTCFHQETCLSGVTHSLVGDGVCNDETNIAECDYDGGDCCHCVFTEHCEDCACLSGVLDGGITNPLVGDGVCNDKTNNAECDYDGGDCCPNPNMVGDGICNDETNNLECNYDGGDCCGPAVSCKY